MRRWIINKLRIWKAEVLSKNQQERGIKNMKDILGQLQKNAHSEAMWALLDDICIENQNNYFFISLRGF